MDDAAPKKKSVLVWVLVAVLGVVGCICGIGILAAIAIPGFVSYAKRSKYAEVQTQLRVLGRSVEAYCHEHGTLPGNAGPEPPQPSSTKRLGNFAADPVFTALQFDPGIPVMYSYAIEQDGAGGVRLVARGDLDDDGTMSETVSRCSASCVCTAPAGRGGAADLE